MRSGLILDPKTLLPVNREIVLGDLFQMSRYWKRVNLRAFIRNNNYEISKIALTLLVESCKKFPRKLRKDGRGEIVHPLRVGQMLALFSVWHAYIFFKKVVRFDEILALTLVHDLQEDDFEDTIEDFPRLFSQEFLFWLDNISIREGESKYDYFQRVPLTYESLLVKVFDRIHNTRNKTKHLVLNEGFFGIAKAEKQDRETKEYLIPAIGKMLMTLNKNDLMHFAYLELIGAVEESKTAIEMVNLSK